MVGNFPLFIDGHPGSKVEGAKEFLALVQETSELGEPPWADRDIGVQVSSTILCSLASRDGLIHDSFTRFFGCHRQFHALRRTFGPAALLSMRRFRPTLRTQVSGVPNPVISICARESGARLLAVTRERIERFFKNLGSALGHCIFEDAEVLGIVIPVLVCLGIFWLIGVAVYDFVLDPHITTAAALDSLSIDPDKWFPR